MTEKTKRIEIAFLTALIAAPFLAAGVGQVLEQTGQDGVLFTAAPVIGAPSYFLVGAPFFLYGVGRGWRLAAVYALLGFLANLVAAPLFGLAVLTTQGRLSDMRDATIFVGGFGLFFAPIFGLLFGSVYWASTIGAEGRPPAWTTSPKALARLVAAQIGAGYLVALLGLAIWFSPAGGGVELSDWWQRTLLIMLTTAVLCAPVLYGLRLFRQGALWIHALGGALVAPLVAIVFTFYEPAAPYAVTLGQIAAGALYISIARLLAGPLQEAAS